MGLYTDLQADLKSAFDGDLSDATDTLVITMENVSAYDPALGQPVSTTESFSMRCVVLKDLIGQDPDDPLKSDELLILVLDSEKTVDSFAVEMEVAIRGAKYEINGLAIDPVSATHTLKCRKKS